MPFVVAGENFCQCLLLTFQPNVLKVCFVHSKHYAILLHDENVIIFSIKVHNLAISCANKRKENVSYQNNKTKTSS